MKTELLAPAGDIESGYAAFYYGADAVYLGLPRFSARAQAINFTAEQLNELTAYAHSVGKKVYVALNTLIQENELSDMLNALTVCEECAVDAVIVQDLGVAALVKKCFPSLALHASTQLAVHNLEGVLALKKIGFSRVVLARELTLKEILFIQEHSDVEIEVFIHGALCYSYSGLCSFSSMETGRSANRGKCIYACRDVFVRGKEKTRLFSMKDLALQTDVLKLKNISLKIEGRKKNALYVAAVTKYYRTLLDTGRENVSLADHIRQIFARPWTKLYFNGKTKDVTDPTFAGHRGLPVGTVEKVFNHEITLTPTRPIGRYDGIQLDVPGQEKPFGFSAEHLKIGRKNVFEIPVGQKAQIGLPPHHPFIEKGMTVYLASSGVVKGAYPYTKPKPGLFRKKQLVDVDIFISKEQVSALADSASVSIPGCFEAARRPETISEQIQNVFEKNGDTAFELGQLTIHNPEQRFVPVSLLNELRRRFYASIPVEKRQVLLPETPFLKPFKRQRERWIIKTDQPTALALIPDALVDEYLIELDKQVTPDNIKHLNPEKVRLAIPVIVRASALIKNKIDLFYQAGYRKWEIANIGGLELIPEGADFSFDASLYCLNTQSMNMAFSLNATRITFSPEDTKENIDVLSRMSDKTCLIVYQHVPLFISANCLRNNSCENCTHKPQYEVISGALGQFNVISKACLTIVSDTRVFSLSKEYKKVAAGAYRIDLTGMPYTAEKALQVWRQIQAGESFVNEMTGNFNKKFA